MDRYAALILIVVISVFHLVSFSTARNFPAVKDGVIISGEVADVSKTVNGKLVRCKSEDDHFTAAGVYVTGKYGPLVLNVLPKGSVPGSGPSKRINAVKT